MKMSLIQSKTIPSPPNTFDVLVALVELCEREKHVRSGTIMFSKKEKAYQEAKQLVKTLKL